MFRHMKYEFIDRIMLWSNGLERDYSLMTWIHLSWSQDGNENHSLHDSKSM